MKMEKKGTATIEVIMWVVVTSVLTLVLLILINTFIVNKGGKTLAEGSEPVTGGISDAFKNLFGIKTAEAAEQAYGSADTFFFDEPKEVSIGLEKYYIKAEDTGSDSVELTIAKDEKLKEKISCSTNFEIFSVGDERCCEKADVGLCIKFLGFEKDKETNAKIGVKLNICSKSEIPLPSAKKLSIGGEREVKFWFKNQEYSVYLKTVSDGGIGSAYCTFIVYKYDTNKRMACGGSEFNLKNNKDKECRDEGFKVVLDDFNVKNKWAVISVVDVTQSSSGGSAG